MSYSTKPKQNKKAPTSGVLVGTDTIYTPGQDLFFSPFNNSEKENLGASSFLNEVASFRNGFIPVVVLKSVQATDEGVEFMIVVNDVFHEGKEVNAWEFYNKYPEKVEKVIKDMLLSYDENMVVSNMKFEKGSLVVIFTIVTTGAVVAALKGLAIGASVTSALFALYSAMERKPDVKEAMDNLDKTVVQTITEFVENTLNSFRKIFGRWFGDRGMGYEPA